MLVHGWPSQFLYIRVMIHYLSECYTRTLINNEPWNEQDILQQSLHARAVREHVNSTELTIKHSRNALTSGPKILDIIGSGIWGAETGVVTVPLETVDFSGDETGIGGGGISSDAFPVLARVVPAVVFEALLARGAVFGGIASQLSSNQEEGVRTKSTIGFYELWGCICGNWRIVGRIGRIRGGPT